MATNPPILYIIMRNDLSSMTPGRAAAQASHCSNHAVSRIKLWGGQTLLEQWENETNQSFGTAIVLGANIQQIYDIRNQITNNFLETPQFIHTTVKLYNDITHDPEYAVRDGEVVHLIPLDTCMWIFGRKDDIKPFVEHLPLY